MIPVAQPHIGEKELEYVIDAVKSGWVSSIGKYINQFEEKFAGYCRTRYAIFTANGTTALHLALVSLGIGRGDEVIVPDLTFIATANAVTYTGAKAVFVDSHPDYWCIDPQQLEKAITAKTKAIIVVHLYGHPADMDPIMRIAKKYKLYVIEDAAEAHGAEYKKRRVGSIGNIGVFSFFGNKIITTGEGGMLVTNNFKVAKRVKLLKDHGMDSRRRYWHPIVGYNYRATNLQAALGVAQLEQIGLMIEKKRELAKQYNSFLKNIYGITLPPQQKWAKSVYWMYSVLIDKKRFGISRDSLISELREKGIDSRPFFHPIHRQPPYKTNNNFPIAEKLGKEGINLPSSTELSSADIEYICNTIKQISYNARKQ